MLDALAHHVDAPLQIDAGGAGDEQLTEGGHGIAGEGTQRRVVMRNLTPTQDRQTLCLDDLLDGLARCGGVLGPLRQEGDTGRVAALGG
ncbi:Uncharacterised protein [Mycobacteroides abscessus subsp. abscessus]|nr:Uncharacterised protein [Mycobacteroides abscessus subsp. abscessus]